MNSRGQFFIIFIITCAIISGLFYIVFRRPSKPFVPSHKKPTEVDKKSVKTKFASYLTKIKQGLPGMGKKPATSSKNDTNLGKPLPAPNMPVAPPPLIIKALPAGPPAKKKMME